MTPIVGFFVFLLLTVAALGVVVATGLRRRRRLHVTFVIVALGLLGGAIVYALRVGEIYDLEAAGAITPIHLNLARITTVCYLLPAITGVLTWRDARWRKLHGRLAWTIVALTIVTTITGAMMLMGAERIG
jgi:drug/metabolite transporter (DMT)-like permease